MSSSSSTSILATNVAPAHVCGAACESPFVWLAKSEHCAAYLATVKDSAFVRELEATWKARPCPKPRVEGWVGYDNCHIAGHCTTMLASSNGAVTNAKLREVLAKRLEGIQKSLCEEKKEHWVDVYVLVTNRGIMGLGTLLIQPGVDLEEGWQAVVREFQTKLREMLCKIGTDFHREQLYIPCPNTEISDGGCLRLLSEGRYEYVL